MEKMMDKIINRYGFESKVTIAFCTMCESGKYTEKEIEKKFKNLMKTY